MNPLRRLALVLLLASACTPPPDPTPEPTLPVDPTPAPYTPRWAFRPWISKDISTTDDTYAFVQGFADRNIPVGAVVLDSPWATNYQTFQPSPSRYQNFEKLLSDLHARDIKLVLWTTPLINVESFDAEPGGDTYSGAAPNYAEAKRGNFFVNDNALNLWWKGRGGAIDFFNRDAVLFWHAQQEYLLNLGVDGWKLDFGEDYIEQRPIKTATGEVSLQEYSEEYYRDFLAHGVAKRGREFVTMTRPWDESYNFPGRFYARRGEASVYWVGDNRRDWVGLRDALDHIFRSAAAGYVAVGSDIGGYLDRDDKQLSQLVPADTEVFIRWTALGAMTPFMQLHGRANLTPWTVPDRQTESVDAWRYWATLHDDMNPFWYSLAQRSYADGTSALHPEGELAQWTNDYRFAVGEAFFVAPLVAAGGTRDVALPAGVRYFDWWAPSADPINGGQTLTAYAGASALPRIPLFVREGAIVPMHIKSDVTGLGVAASKDQLTVLMWPGSTKSEFQLTDDDEQPTTIDCQRQGNTVTANVSRAVKPVLFRIWTGASPTAVTVNGVAAASRADLNALASGNAPGFFYEASTRTAWVRGTAGGSLAVSLQLP